MVGSLIAADHSFDNQAMAMNPILEQWQVQCARFVQFPPISSVSSSAAATPRQPLLIPRSSTSRKFRRGGFWFSTSSSSSATAPAVVGTASLKLIAVSSADGVLNLSISVAKSS